jgi:hypothetical protein
MMAIVRIGGSLPQGRRGSVRHNENSASPGGEAVGRQTDFATEIQPWPDPQSGDKGLIVLMATACRRF